MANTKKYISLDKLSLYDEKIKKLIADNDSAAVQSAKDYADSLAVNYDVAGAAATAEANAKSYADGKDAAIAEAKQAGVNAQAAAEAADAKAVAAQGEVDALETYVGTIPSVDGTPVAASVIAYVDKKTEGIATDTALGELQATVTQLGQDVDAIEADYLKGADKTELEGKISTAQAAAEAAQGEVDALEGVHAADKAALEASIALKADQTALDAVSGVANAAATKTALEEEVNRAKGEEGRIEGLVTAEAERAAGAESGLDERLVEVEAFFKLAEGEQLDTALDTLVEIQNYITTEGAAADQMVLDIAANQKAIEDHIATNHDFAAADTALKNELTEEINKKADSTTVSGIDGRLTTAEGKVTTLEGKVSTLEGEMDAVEGAVATKAEAQALTDAVAALEGADAGQVERIAALEAKFGDGEGSVADQIADAKQEAIDAAASAADTKDEAILAAAKKYADDEDAQIESRVGALETASATHALASDLTALDGRVTTAEGEIDTLQSEMDAVEAKAAANEGAIATINTELAKKAAQADLEAVSGRVTAIETWHSNFVEVSEEEINALFA